MGNIIMQSLGFAMDRLSKCVAAEVATVSLSTWVIAFAQAADYSVIKDESKGNIKRAVEVVLP
jgi:hypothetical protein